MKSVFITLASLVAVSAVVPAQAAPAKTFTCFYQVDSSRLTGYYGSCTEQQLIAAGFGRLAITHVPEVPTLTAVDTRDSGGNGGGGGGGGGGIGR
jgi:hypothetical protein